MTPLEAMARAIQQVAEQNGAPCYEHLRSQYPDSFEQLQEQARAALTALRDAGVTQRMADAADVGSMSKHVSMLGLREAQWRAMLDAVLEEK